MSNSVFDSLGLEIFGSDGAPSRRNVPTRTYAEAPRDTLVHAETDVLVIGGGPAGTAAAVSAARLGADVTLVERYNHLGGLSTGGLVIWIDRMTDWAGQQVISGFAKDILDRLPAAAVMGPPRDIWGSKDPKLTRHWGYRSAAFHDVVTWSPTIDPEALKTLSMQIVREHGVKLMLHAMAVAPIVECNRVRGAIFESKEGRRAILAKVVIDTTGDVDIISRSGAPLDVSVDADDIHHCSNTAFLFGGVDMEAWTRFRSEDAAGFAEFMKRGRERLRYFEKPFFSWRPDIGLFMGPRLAGYNAVKLLDLTEIEIKSRELMVGHLDIYRAHGPGFQNAFIMLAAPQLGVRHTRRFFSSRKVTRAQWDQGTIWDDEIGVSPSLAPKWRNISVPLGCLLPEGLEGILGAGRHIGCDAGSHSFLREIPQCWMTGQASGVAAALAANAGIAPRDVEIGHVQRELIKAGVHLSEQIVESCSL